MLPRLATVAAAAVGMILATFSSAAPVGEVVCAFTSTVPSPLPQAPSSAAGTAARPDCIGNAARSTTTTTTPLLLLRMADGAGEDASTASSSSSSTDDIIASHSHSRRTILGRATSAASAAALASLSLPSPAAAADVTAVAQQQQQQQPVEMKLYTDPLFTLRIPSRYYTLRRTAKGDLPNAQTGTGRRGSSIFTAGDMSKAEVIAVERFPIRVLLEEAGVAPDAIREAELNRIEKIGTPQTVAELLALRRDRDKSGSSNRSVVQRDSIKVSDDGKTISFALRVQIDVQKPELLMEQMGVSELYRDTLGKATLEGDDGYIMAVFGSALETDFGGVDGVALRDSVDSFRALKAGS